MHSAVFGKSARRNSHVQNFLLFYCQRSCQSTAFICNFLGLIKWLATLNGLTLYTNIIIKSIEQCPISYLIEPKLARLKILIPLINTEFIFHRLLLIKYWWKIHHLFSFLILRQLFYLNLFWWSKQAIAMDTSLIFVIVIIFYFCVVFPVINSWNGFINLNLTNQYFKL